MPPLEEGAIFYMPTTMPGISVAEAKRVLQVSDWVLKQFPEVEYILSKAGRTETPTDPVRLSMRETVIILKPKSEWRHVDFWCSSWAPECLKPALRHTPGHDFLAGTDQAHGRAALRVPGVSNAWTMPIKGHIDNAQHRNPHARCRRYEGRVLARH